MIVHEFPDNYKQYKATKWKKRSSIFCIYLRSRSEWNQCHVLIKTSHIHLHKVHAGGKRNFVWSHRKLDPLGHFIICDINANEKRLTLANIYAPNEDNPAFFLDFFGHLDDFKYDDIIIGGDFNLVLDLEKDKLGGIAKTHQNSAKIIQEFSDKLDLVDTWRVLHPEARIEVYVETTSAQTTMQTRLFLGKSKCR